MDATAVGLGVLIVAIAMLGIGIALVAGDRTRPNGQTPGLRHIFGPEYDRVVQQFGDRRGENELQARLQHRRQLQIRRLGEDERERFISAWRTAQLTFVEAPRAGLREADLIVMQVMRERGYPVENFGERSRLLSVDYPELVQHFRTAHAVAVANEAERAGTEDLRRAMLQYRYLFDEMMEGGDPVRTRRI